MRSLIDIFSYLEIISHRLSTRVQRVLGLGLGLVEASEARSLDEAEAMFFSSLLESFYY